ncbi:hypothetical protein ACFOLG_01220 [Vogesella facilis]|uniref:Uncharacterized protein n=1 Tax=Vogesella facilis TaxID=1655232 RepID=A0ABV7RC05_9NEIS
MMRALELDFVPARGVRLGRVLWLLLALAALLATGWHYRQSLRSLQQLQAVANHNQQSLQRLNAGGEQKPDPALHKQIVQANAVWDALSQPWDALFAELETAANKQVALLALEADGNKRLLHITAEVKQRQALLDYIARLERLPGLSAVTLQEHHINVQDKELPIRFTLQAHWETAS